MRRLRHDAGRGSEDGRFDPFEVLLIAADDRWGTTLRPELVEAGRRDHQDLPLLPARRSDR